MILAQAPPQPVKHDSIKRAVTPLLTRINERYNQKVREFIDKDWPPGFNHDDFKRALSDIFDDVLKVFERIFGSLEDALFIGDGPIQFGEGINGLLVEIAADSIPHADEGQRSRLVELSKLLLSVGPGTSRTI